MKQSIANRNLLFPNPVLVVGTYDKKGDPNVATLAWGGIASSTPERVSIAVRPTRYTHEALMRTKAFTINLPAVEHAAAVDYFGLVSGRDERKLETTGLTPVRGTCVDAPYIQEFPFSLECKVSHTLDLSSHTLFIGEVQDAKMEEAFFDDEGSLLWEDAKILTFDSGLRVYRSPGEIVGQGFSIGKKYIAS